MGQAYDILGKCKLSSLGLYSIYSVQYMCSGALDL